jgi:hypothetical protein
MCHWVPKMRLIISLFSILFLPSIQISAGPLSPPNLNTQILVDTKVENPPSYNGVWFAPRPSQGGTIGIQIFVPQAAGKPAFSYLIDFGPTKDFTKYFTIQDANTWIRYSITQPSGQITVKESQVTLTGPASSSSRSIHFMASPSVHQSGQIATLVLRAIENPPANFALRLDVNVAVYATTPPSRLLQMKGQATVQLQ